MTWKNYVNTCSRKVIHVYAETQTENDIFEKQKWQEVKVQENVLK